MKSKTIRMAPELADRLALTALLRTAQAIYTYGDDSRRVTEACVLSERLSRGLATVDQLRKDIATFPPKLVARLRGEAKSRHAAYVRAGRKGGRS